VEHKKINSLKRGGRIIVVITMLLTSLVLGSCGLKRNNPLDPLGNTSIIPPDPVNGITVTPSVTNASVKSVTVRWRANNSENTTGYYIYRGMGYYSAFSIVGETQDSIYVHTGPTVRPGVEYYYKVSAFKTYPQGKLEGRRSDPKWVYIPF
jgi:hypothetical protein